MRAVWSMRHGGPEALSIRETPDAEPGPGELRIRVRAASITFADLLALRGQHPDAPRPPHRLGHEGAGIVEALGQDVSGPPPGTRVAFLSPFSTQATTACVPRAHLCALPDSLDFEEAAVLPVDYLTAWHALRVAGRLGPGQRVLVHLAGTSLGRALLELCRAVPDVEVLATAPTTCHPELRELGCRELFDRSTGDYARWVRARTREQGVDLVVDPLGGRDWSIGYGLLRPGGVLVACGLSNASGPGGRTLRGLLTELWRMPRLSPLRLMGDNRGVAGVDLGHLLSSGTRLDAALEELMDLASRREITPRVATTHALDDAATAYRHLATHAESAKLVLCPD